MPGAYTHLYIADLIVERLGKGQLQTDGTIKSIKEKLARLNHE